MKAVPGFLGFAIAVILSVPQPAIAENEKSTIIFLMHDGIELQTMQSYAEEYKRWETPEVEVLLRVQNKGRQLKATIRFCEAKGFPYLITAASSDFLACPLAMKTMYRDLKTEVFPYLSSKQCKGSYLHELFAQHATDLKGWDPKQIGESAMNWKWLERLAQETAKQGKTIYWSDGGLSWKMPYVSKMAHEYFRKYGNYIVPLFAVNFLGSFEENGDWGQKLVKDNDTALGLSVQDWYFLVKQKTLQPLREGKIAYESIDISEGKMLELFKLGKKKGCRVYQIEGTQEGMSPDSGFMKSVKSFMRSNSKKKVERSSNKPDAGDGK